MRNQKIQLREKSQAHTLLELVLSMAILLLILGGVFGVISSSLDLSNELNLAVRKSSLRGNFINIMRANFQKLPPDTRINLKKRQEKDGYFFTLDLKNCANFLGAGKFMGKYERVILQSVMQSGGFIALNAYFLRAEDVEIFDKGMELPSERKILLLSNLSFLDLRLFKDDSYASNRKWREHWEERDGKPLFVEIKIKHFSDDAVDTHVIRLLKLLKVNVALNSADAE